MTNFAVAWLGIYPNVMIELYAGLRVVSLVLPTGPDTHVNRVHYLVPSDMETHVPGLAATMKVAFDETGAEDCHMVESRQTGVRAAQSLGFDLEPYWVNTTGSAPEAGTAHFYDWYRRTLSR
jgi:phenylpropionate dioxygenase-like ring-hydroxylating dioxygenase large terminal subunit